MDVFTHFMVPYLLFALLRRPQAERVAAGLGGYAPDLDVLTSPIVFLDERIYFLGHRGFSHSLVGAPIHAAVLMLVLALPFWARKFPRMQALAFSWPLLLVAMAASQTHLLLDWLTFWGVPLLYPWSTERFTIGFAFYNVMLALPLSLWLCWRIARGTLTPRILRVGGTALIAVLVLSCAFRVGLRPPESEWDVAHATTWEWQWTTMEREEDGWRATDWSWLEPGEQRFYPDDRPATPEEEAALAAAKASLRYARFHLYAGGPETVHIEPREDGAYNVTFADLMGRNQADRARWFPGSQDRGLLKLVVEDGVVNVRED